MPGAGRVSLHTRIRPMAGSIAAPIAEDGAALLRDEHCGCGDQSNRYGECGGVLDGQVDAGGPCQGEGRRCCQGARDDPDYSFESAAFTISRCVGMGPWSSLLSVMAERPVAR